jgi:hypothetical protein
VGRLDTPTFSEKILGEETCYISDCKAHTVLGNVVYGKSVSYIPENMINHFILYFRIVKSRRILVQKTLVKWPLGRAKM